MVQPLNRRIVTEDEIQDFLTLDDAGTLANTSAFTNKYELKGQGGGAGIPDFDLDSAVGRYSLQLRNSTTQTVMQGAYVEPKLNGDIFLTQVDSGSVTGRESTRITRTNSAGYPKSNMLLTDAGHGTSLFTEVDDDGRLWVWTSFINEAVSSGAGRYNLVRLPWVDGSTWTWTDASAYRVDYFDDNYARFAYDPKADNVGVVTSVSNTGTAATFQIGSFNLRLASAGDTGNRAWSVRLPYAAQTVIDSGASIVSLNEVSYMTDPATSQGVQLVNQINTILGATDRWKIMNGTAGSNCIAWDSSVIQSLSEPVTQDVNEVYTEGSQRTIVYATFRHIATSRDFAYAVTHWQHDDPDVANGTRRRIEAAKITARVLDQLRSSYGVVFLGGDFNIASQTDAAQRGYLTSRGYRSVQAAVTPTNGTLNSYNGWDETMAGKQNSAWMDGLYTTPNVTINSARLEAKFASGSSLPLATPLPSDHQMISANVTIPADTKNTTFTLTVRSRANLVAGSNVIVNGPTAATISAGIFQGWGILDDTFYILSGTDTASSDGYYPATIYRFAITGGGRLADVDIENLRPTPYNDIDMGFSEPEGLSFYLAGSGEPIMVSGFTGGASGRRLNKLVTWSMTGAGLPGEILAASADSFSDTGWTSVGLTIPSGFTQDSTRPIQARRIGRRVYVRGRYSAIPTPSNGMTVLTLPAYFRPAASTNGPIYGNVVTTNYSGIMRGDINTSGVMSVYYPSGIYTPTWFAFDGFFFDLD